jgi:hypothetical protein
MTTARILKAFSDIPAIAYLMKIGVLSFDQKLGRPFKRNSWKDINQKFKNDFDKLHSSHILSKKRRREKSACRIMLRK